MSIKADWIAVDWGTSSLRAWAMNADGQDLETASSDQRNGQTKFQWEESLNFPFWMGGPLRNFVGRKILEKVWAHNLENLKDWVEGNLSSS